MSDHRERACKLCGSLQHNEDTCPAPDRWLDDGQGWRAPAAASAPAPEQATAQVNDGSGWRPMRIGEAPTPFSEPAPASPPVPAAERVCGYEAYPDPQTGVELYRPAAAPVPAGSPGAPATSISARFDDAVNALSLAWRQGLPQREIAARRLALQTVLNDWLEIEAGAGSPGAPATTPEPTGCTDAEPCLAPMLRWVHSPKCREATALLAARELRGRVATLSRDRDEAVIALAKLIAAWDAPSDPPEDWDRAWKAAEAEARRVVAKYPNLRDGKEE